MTGQLLENDRIMWVDFEGTGVPEKGPIYPLELGMILTDRFGEEIDVYESPILTYGWRGMLQNDFVRNMHETSGLTHDLEELARDQGAPAYRRFSIQAVEARAVGWMMKWLPEADMKGPLMAGSSVHYDRHLMIHHMPQLNRLFNYRNLDISSIGGACKLLNPELHAKRPDNPFPAHRPLADIRESISHYKWLQENFLFIEGDRRW